jgi:hypothetical protein
MHLLGMTVAVNSIMAMLFRTAIWIGIMMLIKSRSRGYEWKGGLELRLLKELCDA